MIELLLRAGEAVLDLGFGQLDHQVGPREGPLAVRDVGPSRSAGCPC
jgi:hypothetical protein